MFHKVYTVLCFSLAAEASSDWTQVEVREEVCTRLIDTVRKVSSEFQSAEVTVKQVDSSGIWLFSFEMHTTQKYLIFTIWTGELSTFLEVLFGQGICGLGVCFLVAWFALTRISKRTCYC